jgi:hypothetical protein
MRTRARGSTPLLSKAARLAACAVRPGPFSTRSITICRCFAAGSLMGHDSTGPDRQDGCRTFASRPDVRADVVTAAGAAPYTRVRCGSVGNRPAAVHPRRPLHGLYALSSAGSDWMEWKVLAIEEPGAVLQPGSAAELRPPHANGQVAQPQVQRNAAGGAGGSGARADAHRDARGPRRQPEHAAGDRRAGARLGAPRPRARDEGSRLVASWFGGGGIGPAAICPFVGSACRRTSGGLQPRVEATAVSPWSP